MLNYLFSLAIVSLVATACITNNKSVVKAKTAELQDVNIYYETFGNQKNPATLLMMGNGAQSVFWTDEFCELLAKKERFVIRYDYRDTGLSSYINFEKHPYDFMDMVLDAVRLLKNIGVQKAHIVGLSMGGFLAQLMALHYPQHVLSITLMMTTSDYSVLIDALDGKQPSNQSLPPMKKEFVDAIGSINPQLNEIEFMVANWRAANGKKAPFDEQYWRNLQTLSQSRTSNSNAAANHMKAARRTHEKNLLPQLPNLRVPALVIQGAEDPIFPPPHGKISAQAIPNAKLLVVENMGHALAPQFFNQIINAITSLR